MRLLFESKKSSSTPQYWTRTITTAVIIGFLHCLTENKSLTLEARLRRTPLGDGPRKLPSLGAHGREACRPAAARRALPRLETRARVDEVRLCVPSQPAGPRSEVRFFLWNRSVTALESGPSMPV